MRHPQLTVRRAVLLVGHGSRDRRAAITVARIAAAVRAELPGRRVAVAHLDFTEPGVGEALTELAAEGAREIAVVPLLFAPGYHLRVDLPSAVAEVRAGLPWLSVSIAEPLAAAPELDEPDALLDALEARLSERTSEYDAVVLASAGSSDPVARQAIEAVAGRWSQRLGRPVDAAYATAATPTVAEAVTRLQAQGCARVAVSGLFIAPGRLPEAVRRSADDAGAVAVAEPLGAAPGLVRLVARRSNRAKAHSLDAH